MTQSLAAERRMVRVDEGDILAVVLFAAPPLALYAAPGIALLAGVAALAIAVLALLQGKWPRLGAPGVFLVLGAVIVWGAISGLWSIRPDESVRRALQLAAIFLGGSILIGAAGGLTEAQRRRVGVAVSLGTAIALAAVAFEVISNNGLRRLFEPGIDFNVALMNRGSTLLVLMLPAAAAFCWREGRRGNAILLIIGVALAAVMLHSAAARVAWCAGIAVAVAAWYAPRAVTLMLGIAVAALVLLAPLLPRLVPPPDPARVETREHLPPSAAHRLLVWNYAAGKIAERPLSGFGLDTGRSLPDARKVLPWDKGAENAPHVRFTTIVLMPLHPHNAPLQWWMELGLPGALLGLAVLLLTLREISRAPLGRADRAAALGLFAAAIMVAMISYGAWQSWWLMTLFLASTGIAASSTAPRSGAT